MYSKDELEAKRKCIKLTQTGWVFVEDMGERFDSIIDSHLEALDVIESLRNWNACEEELHGQLLESDKRRIELEIEVDRYTEVLQQAKCLLPDAINEYKTTGGFKDAAHKLVIDIEAIDKLIGGEG